MQAENQRFISDFIVFCRESLRWCATESEQSVNAIMAVLDHLLTDTKRIALMSKETLALLAEIKSSVSQKTAPASGARGQVAELVKSLRKLSERQQDVNEILSPVVETLQFQDRIRQNMENLTRMCDAWISYRDSLADKGDSFPAARNEFGQRLLACSTMREERDTIRHYIRTLPPEAETSSGEAMLF